MNLTELSYTSNSLELKRLSSENQHYREALRSIEQITVNLLSEHPSFLNTKTMKITSANILDKEHTKKYLVSIIQILGVEKIADQLNNV